MQFFRFFFSLDIVWRLLVHFLFSKLPWNRLKFDINFHAILFLNSTFFPRSVCTVQMDSITLYQYLCIDYKWSFKMCLSKSIPIVSIFAVSAMIRIRWRKIHEMKQFFFLWNFTLPKSAYTINSVGNNRKTCHMTESWPLNISYPISVLFVLVHFRFRFWSFFLVSSIFTCLCVVTFSFYTFRFFFSILSSINPI